MTVGAGLFIDRNEKDPVKQNTAIQQLIEGRSNAVGTFTLTASATSTTVTSPNCATTSVIVPFPSTANAANDFGLMSIVPGKGQFVVTHANNSRIDRTFLYVVQG